MHHLLERQIKKIFKEKLPIETTSHKQELDILLETISDTYEGFDHDRMLLNRSFDISSREFSELNEQIVQLNKELELEKESIEQKVIERTKELTVANERLQSLDKVKTEFISVAAHQLRTPLSAVKWTLSILLEGDTDNLTTEQKGLLMKGYESNERIIKLINQMLVVSRIESGKIQYESTFIHIEDVIDSVLLDFTGHTEADSPQIIFNRPTAPLPYIYADPEKIRIIIQNLIENALFYTKAPGTITITTSCSNDYIRIAIQDTGIGIPKHQQPGIFNKFFRANNAIKERTDGSGLGLFITKGIIDKYNGDIGFESTEGVGTTFYFTLPTAHNTPNNS